MSDKSLRIPVGESVEVNTSGTYIAVKSSNVKLDIHVDGEGNQLLSQGDAWHIDSGFNSFTVENYGLVDAVVLLAVGRGSFRAGQLVGTIDSVNTIVNPVTVNTHNIGSILNVVNVKNSLQAISYFQRFPSSAGIITIVTPSANINGIRVLNSAIDSLVGQTAAFVANPTAPTAPVDCYNNTMAMIFGRKWQAASAQLQNEFIIPAGLGLYMCCTSGAMLSIDYEVF